MKRRILLGSLMASLLAAALAASPAGGPGDQSCAGLVSVDLPDAMIRSAQEVAAPTFTPAGSVALTNLPAFCRVAAVTRPAINFEIWLPLAGWNGKFQGVGNGANAGSISFAAM